MSIATQSQRNADRKTAASSPTAMMAIEISFGIGFSDCWDLPSNQLGEERTES